MNGKTIRTAVFVGLLLICIAASAAASNIVLRPGQSYRSGGDTIVCTQGGRQAEEVVLQECQVWDDFNKKCLYEKTRHIFGDVECLEECQHWDDFNKRCDYATSCSFQPSSGTFVQTTCDKFDSFNHRCERQKQRLIGGGERRPDKP